MKQNAIEIKDLRKSFPKFELGPLDLSVPAGAIYGFVGPNGAGKTTTLDLMFGMGRRDGGSMQLLGLDSEANEVEIKQRVAYVSPDLNYQVWNKVSHAIQFISGFYPSWDQAYCDELLRRFKIEASERITALSFGNKIKLALVLALARHPEMLILDEPTVGLDALSKREVFSQLLTMMQDEQHTVLVSSHNLADLERFTDHIGIIHDGRMLLEGRTDEILTSHQQFDFNLTGELPHGARIVSQEGTRYRVITSDSSNYRVALETQKATQINQTALSLEELFVGLVEDRQS